jgi:hypothetical protein
MSLSDDLRVPGFCPQCQLLMKSNRSTNSYYDFGVCMLCFIQFIEGREERWRNGWRPSPEEVEALVQSASKN